MPVESPAGQEHARTIMGDIANDKRDMFESHRGNGMRRDGYALHNRQLQIAKQVGIDALSDATTPELPLPSHNEEPDTEIEDMHAFIENQHPGVSAHRS